MRRRIHTGLTPVGAAMAVALWLWAGPAQAQGVTAAPVVAAQPAAGQGGAQVGGLRGLLDDVARLEGQQRAAAQAQAGREREAAAEAAEIERKKGEEPGVARDLQLEQLLARAQARAAELSQRAAELRRLSGQLVQARRAVVQAADRQLQAGADLPAAARLELLRVRAAQVEVLSGPSSGVAGLPGVGVAGGGDSGDPRELRERADLLLDTVDKLGREVARLEQREKEIQRRRELRERAVAVDADLFMEQATSRRANAGSSSRGGVFDAAPQAGAPAPAGTGAGGPTGGPAPPATATGYARGFDPALMELMRRVDGSSDREARSAAVLDPEVKLEVLRRARGELRRLMEQYGARAAGLSVRAAELQRGK